ncbi:hypothetical protein PoB_000330400 [Plakobranchus ocellatus]|uniref:Uncharacterized protein n=1 Tax=Plakobranchus ocellatus TaxID=259542 RepID=A0AAV3Y1H0_9GAST|nr:hypothetical protein PoB_000330400 [Plakobranchus ocellatus]
MKFLLVLSNQETRKNGTPSLASLQMSSLIKLRANKLIPSFEGYSQCDDDNDDDDEEKKEEEEEEEEEEEKEEEEDYEDDEDDEHDDDDCHCCHP